MKDAIQQRNYSLDVARVFAIFAVIMIHCSAPFLSEYQIFSREFTFGNLFNSISRLGVPLFLMISGSLFLDEKKEITLKGILSKNVKNLAITTIIWATIYSLVNNVILVLMAGNEVSVKSVFATIVTGQYHMWYLYMIMGLYIITPFLKSFVRKENKGMVLAFIAMAFIMQFLLPAASKLLIKYFEIYWIDYLLNETITVFFNGFTIYFLAGWYIVHVGIERKFIRFIIYLMGLLSLAYMIYTVHHTGYYKDAYANLGIPVFVYATSVFLALNNIKFNFKGRAAKILVQLSKLTFGAYIVHVLVLYVLAKFLPYNNQGVSFLIIRFIIVTFVSFAIAFIISKIPLIKKIIRA